VQTVWFEQKLIEFTTRNSDLNGEWSADGHLVPMVTYSLWSARPRRGFSLGVIIHESKSMNAVSGGGTERPLDVSTFKLQLKGAEA
jgi:hypothetical protein